MLRVVFDTNIIISGILWSGAPKRAITAAQEGLVKAFISEAMLDEFVDVVARPKFLSRLNLLNKTPNSVITEYLGFAEIVEANDIPPIVLADRDDDMVLACAFSAQADCVISGDPHLLELNTVQHIPILSVSIFLQQIEDAASHQR